MKAFLRAKVQKAISKIESGEFDELVVDSLFSGLRQYSGNSLLFRELADFIAHPDERNEGIANESLEAFYLSIRYFTEYASSQKSLDLSRPFPQYIIRLMKYQINKCKERDLKDRFNVTKSRLGSRIDTIFSIDKKSKKAYVKKENVLRNNFPAIQFILSFIGSHPAFEQEAILSELIAVIKRNKLDIDEDAFRAQSEKLALIILLLMHEAKFEHGGHEPGYCKISCEKTFIYHNQHFVDAEGNPVEIEESFGCLQLLGYVVVPKDGKNLTVCYPVLITNLTVESVCDESMFCIEPLSDNNPQSLFKKIDFEKELVLTDKWTLGAKNA